MSIALTVCVAIILIVLTALGSLNDVRRVLLALLGTLIGATLVQFWAARWADWWTESVGGASARNMFLASSLLFLWGALVVGYGGGLLLGRSGGRLTAQQRIIGGVLGLINAILMVGFLLRYAVVQQPNFAALVDATIVAKLIHDWLPTLFLVFAGGVTLLMFVRAIMALATRRRAHSKPVAETTSPAAGTPVPPEKERQVGEASALGKANNAPRQ